jgi:hypothetical protein
METIAHLSTHDILTLLQGAGRRADNNEQAPSVYHAALSEYCTFEDELAMRKTLGCGPRASRVYFVSEDIRALTGGTVPAGATLRIATERGLAALGYIYVKDVSTEKVYEVKRTRLE